MGEVKKREEKSEGEREVEGRGRLPLMMSIFHLVNIRKIFASMASMIGVFSYS